MPDKNTPSVSGGEVKKSARPAPPISQATVDALLKARTMDEFLTLANALGVDWNALPDEWLDAVAQGDVTELTSRLRHKPKTGKIKK